MGVTMRRRMTKGNKGELKRFVLYYSVILLFPLLVSGLLYVTYTNVVKKDIMSSGNANVRQMQEFLDSKIKDVLDITDSIMTDTDFVNYANLSEQDYTTLDRYNIRLLFPKLEQLINSSEYIDSIYVIFPKSHSIIANSFRYHGPSANYMSKSIFDKTLDDLIESLYLNYHSNGILKIRGDNIQGNYLIISRPIIDVKVSELVGFAVVTIRIDKLYEFVETITYNGSIPIIVTADDFTFSSPNIHAEAKANYVLLENGVSFSKGINHDNHVIVCSSSTKTDLKYVLFTSLDTFFAGIRIFKNLFLFYVLLCLICGGGIVWFAATRSYRPIKRLLDIIGNADSELNPFNNEYKVLEKTLSELLLQHKKDKLMHFKNEMVIKEAAIKSLLQAETPNKNLIKHINKLFDSDSKYYVLYFTVNGSSTLYSELQSISNKDDINIPLVIIKSLSEELFSEKGFHAETVLYQGAPVCVLGYADKQNKEADICNTTKHISMLVRENFGMMINVSISDVGTLNSLPNLYCQAKDTAEYHLLFGINTICLKYRDVGFSEDDGSNYMDLVEYERSIIVHIRNKDIQRASESCKALLDNMINADPPISMNLVRTYIPRLKQLVWEAVDNIGHYYEDNSLISQRKPYERMECASNLYQLQDVISEIFYELEEYLTINESNKRCDLINDIIEYIDRNYLDPNLSVTGIAEAVGKTQPYISRLFKDSTGMSMTEYIHKVRIEQVKNLLLEQPEEPMTLQKIAEQAGFTNTWTMNRIFRKYEIVSPGEYRTMQLKSQNL
jgi:two-component system response regulator YesN